MSTKGAYDFQSKETQYADADRYTDAMLAFAFEDAVLSRDTMQGWDVAAENWYADDVHTILAEVNRRKALAEKLAKVAA